MQSFLSRLRNHLTAREEQANSIACEMYSHLCADVESRVNSGQEVGGAVRDSLLELGDAADIAHQFNSVQEVDQRRMTMARNVAAVMLATVGFFGAVFSFGPLDLMNAVAHLLPRNPNGVLLVSGWLAPVYNGLDWLWQHPRIDFILVLPSLAVVGLLVGYVSRGRGWALGFVPFLFFWGMTWQAVARGKFPFIPTQHVGEPVAHIAALLAGMWAGRRLLRASGRARRLIAGIGAAFAMVTCLYAFSQTVEGVGMTAVIVMGYGAVAGAATWATMAVARRLAGRRSTGAAI
jgi:hypothetical protein